MRLAYRELRHRAAEIRFLLLDVDGTLTPGTVLYTGEERSTLPFEIKDGLGIQCARRSGIRVGILSGRGGAALERRASELGIDPVVTNRSDKARAFEELLDSLDLRAREVAYVGDDLTDLPILDRCGLGFAPRDGAKEVRRTAHRVLSRGGGKGCVREAIEILLRAREQWAERVSEYRET
ncbi:MAG: HAD-IIIA family hydrolase [Thermoanaerobaculia bacterium]|nr:HAD-IIIA family hydrolase [Thermoanaerobaculia bacterium]